jgi:hypothetical protein
MHQINVKNVAQTALHVQTQTVHALNALDHHSKISVHSVVVQQAGFIKQRVSNVNPK